MGLDPGSLGREVDGVEQATGLDEGSQGVWCGWRTSRLGDNPAAGYREAVFGLNLDRSAAAGGGGICGETLNCFAKRVKFVDREGTEL